MGPSIYRPWAAALPSHVEMRLVQLPGREARWRETPLTSMRAIADALTTLSAEQREAMTLRVIEQRPYSEVAEMLACTEQTARARVSRGLKRLASLLESAQVEVEVAK